MLGRYDLSTIWQFMLDRLDEITTLTGEHILVVLLSLFFATIIGVTVGLLVWDRPMSRSVSISATAVILTIPSMALLAMMIPVFGLGWLPTVIALSLYSLLPIVRNTVVGLREVSPAVMESATGMGMSRFSVLLRIQFPIAWPVILAGLRVATQLAVGIAAISAYVAGPGLGAYIFKGLSMLGAVHALNFALVGTILIAAIALILDAIFILITRYTTSEGIRG